MLCGFVGHLHNEEIVEALEATVEYVVAHRVVEEINDFLVVTVGLGENELLPRDQHDIVKEDVVASVVTK